MHELVERAKEIGYPALALTDTNMCGALEFAREAKESGLRPITGGDITMMDGSRLTLLAKNRTGYSNISRLFTYASRVDRQNPQLNPDYIPDNGEGTIVITGGRDGTIPRLVYQGYYEAAEQTLRNYMEWFGRDSVYVELQQTMMFGDTRRNHELVRLARKVGAPLVCSNNVFYHVPERFKLQNALTAIKRNSTLSEVIDDLELSGECYLKTAEQMVRLFRWCPGAVENTVRIAEACEFDLTKDLGYRLPTPPVPDGYTPETYLRRLAYESAQRRYGGITDKIEARLQKELRLFEKHNLSGFILLYRDIAVTAYKIMIEEGLVSPETPMEEHPPGRGRGSSVALLVGYLLGLSHVDPLLYDLPLDRFLPEDMSKLPDIDLDFPRSIREKLITRIHSDWGEEHAVLVGAISKYRTRGVITDLGKAFGIPEENLKVLKSISDARTLKQDMLASPEFKDKVNAPLWKDLIELAPQLMGAPRGLGQHVGGMVLSTAPIPEMVPIRDGAIEGRYIMDWDKDTVQDANFAKIDLLSLPVLDQLEEARDLVMERTGVSVDVSRIDPHDADTYKMIGEGKAMCVFDLQSPAQLMMAQRLKPQSYKDIAYQVALIRPGVGMQGSAVSNFVDRYRHGAPWSYDHKLEKDALARGYGIIVWQEQVTQLIMDVAGLTGSEAEEIRRDFSKSNNERLIKRDWVKFRDGALKRDVDEDTARKIFQKINGHYMFPESHSYAFGITAYQAAWFKCHYPIEFYVSFMNSQPMGFYPLEAIKEDAKRHSVLFLNPDINLSNYRCTALEDSVLLGFRFVKNISGESAGVILEERERNGPYRHAGDLVRRTGLKPKAVRSLGLAGAFDNVTPNRKIALWEAGLYSRPSKGQLVLPISMDDSLPELEDFTDYQKMIMEYEIMHIHPKSHLMAYLRSALSSKVITAQKVYDAGERDEVTVAGWPIARQHPRGEEGTTYITIEDETSDIQLIVYPKIFAKFKKELRRDVIIASGKIAKWDGTTSVIVSHITSIQIPAEMPRSHDWH